MRNQTLSHGLWVWLWWGNIQQTFQNPSAQAQSNISVPSVYMVYGCNPKWQKESSRHHDAQYDPHFWLKTFCNDSVRIHYSLEEVWAPFMIYFSFLVLLLLNYLSISIYSIDGSLMERTFSLEANRLKFESWFYHLPVIRYWSFLSFFLKLYWAIVNHC